MGRKDIPETEREKLKKKFKGMMRALYRQEGAILDVEVLRESEVLDFIDAHAAVLDSTFDKVKMSDGMRLSLQKSDWIFSGMKTFHELHEAFPSLLDEHGERKPFERFYSDVRKVDETYNRNYLRAEYNFATASAEMAAKWEQYERDGDRYYLQYRTVGDSHVREEHAAINGTTLPVSHPFWDTHYPPNGWNCRCLAVQVRKSSHEQTSEEELSKRTKALAEQQTKSKGKSEMFRFNPGKQRKVFPDYNPYTIKRCNDCDLAKGKFGKADANELCAGCALLRNCMDSAGCITDKEFGRRLLISTAADKKDLEANITVAKVLLKNFSDMHIQIRENILDGRKNPEYLINGLISDRKSIESENGVTNGFSKAIEQGCSSVVIDLDTNFNFHYVKADKLASKIANRYNDFTKEVIKECYISYKGKAIMIPASIFGDGNLKNKSKWIESIKLRLEELDIIAHKKSLTKK